MFAVHHVPSNAPEKIATSNFGRFHIPWFPLCSRFLILAQPTPRATLTQQNHRTVFESPLSVVYVVPADLRLPPKCLTSCMINLEKKKKNAEITDEHKQISSKSNFDHKICRSSNFEHSDRNKISTAITIPHVKILAGRMKHHKCWCYPAHQTAKREMPKITSEFFFSFFFLLYFAVSRF